MTRLVRPALYLVALNLAAFLAFTLPRTLQERSLASRLETLRAEAGRERGQIEALRRRSETIRVNQVDANRLLRDVIQSRQATLLPALAEIHEAAEAEGLTLGSERYARSDVKDTPLVRLRITLPVTGSYGQLVAFLGRLERAKAFVVVDTVSLQDRDGEASLDVGLSMYFLAGTEPAGA